MRLSYRGSTYRTIPNPIIPIVESAAADAIAQQTGIYHSTLTTIQPLIKPFPPQSVVCLSYRGASYLCFH